MNISPPPPKVRLRPLANPALSPPLSLSLVPLWGGCIRFAVLSLTLIPIGCGRPTVRRLCSSNPPIRGGKPLVIRGTGGLPKLAAPFPGFRLPAYRSTQPPLPPPLSTLRLAYGLPLPPLAKHRGVGAGKTHWVARVGLGFAPSLPPNGVRAEPTVGGKL